MGSGGAAVEKEPQWGKQESGHQETFPSSALRLICSGNFREATGPSCSCALTTAGGEGNPTYLPERMVVKTELMIL